MPIVNFDQIIVKIANAPKVKNEVLSQVKSRIELAKDKMIEDFDNNKITQEIEAGESTNNSSGLLPGLQRGGNLFSFIGFNQGDNPIEIIRNILNNSAKLRSENSRYVRFIGKGLIQFAFTVQVPSLEELYEKTQYPGDTRKGSWLEGITTGLYGLQSYLYDDDGNFEEYDSRSSTGLQAKTKNKKLIIVRKNEAKKDAYITKIIDNFQKQLRKNV